MHDPEAAQPLLAAGPQPEWTSFESRYRVCVMASSHCTTCIEFLRA